MQIKDANQITKSRGKWCLFILYTLHEEKIGNKALVDQQQMKMTARASTLTPATLYTAWYIIQATPVHSTICGYKLRIQQSKATSTG